MFAYATQEFKKKIIKISFVVWILFTICIFHCAENAKFKHHMFKLSKQFNKTCLLHLLGSEFNVE